MTPASLQRALIDLGWQSVTQRALGGKPSETSALRDLIRCAGRPVTHAQLAHWYPKTRTGTADSIRKRVERLRSHLADMGCAEAIQTVVGAHAYLVEKRDVARIEAALLGACGIELQLEDVAA